MKSRTLLTATLSMALLAGGSVGAAAENGDHGSDISSFRTKEIAPGVLRVLDDNAGHDLTRTWPDKRRDIDHIAVSPEGEVWISITAHGDDNSKLKGARLWPLGQEAVLGPSAGLPRDHNSIVFDDDGALWVFGNRIAVGDGTQWTSTRADRSVRAPDGTIWLATPGLGVEAWEEGEVARHLDNTFMDRVFATSDGKVGAIGWGGAYLWDGEDWAALGNQDRRRAVSPSGVLAVLDNRNAGLQLFHEGGETTVLKGTLLNEVALAPDGSLWLAGGVRKGPGGVYRVDPTEVIAAAMAEDESEPGG